MKLFAKLIGLQVLGVLLKPVLTVDMSFVSVKDHQTCQQENMHLLSQLLSNFNKNFANENMFAAGHDHSKSGGGGSTSTSPNS